MNAPMSLFEWQYEMVFGEADRRLADRRQADREATALYAEVYGERRQADRRES